LGRRMYEYLKVLLEMEMEGMEIIRTLDVAKRLSVSPSTVTEMFKKLSKRNHIQYIPYKGIRLTEEGRKLARQLLRNHRILEVFMVEFLGYNVEKACTEAANMDFVVSEEFINRICKLLNHPSTCPHGKPIFSDERCCKRVREEKDEVVTAAEP